MIEHYYDLMPDDGFWVLGPKRLTDEKTPWGAELYGYDPREFQRCSEVKDFPCPAPFEIDRAGDIADINLVVFGAPVISEKAAKLIRVEFSDANIQLFPATIDGHPDSWWVLNALDHIDCLDKDRSKIKYNDLDDKRDPGGLCSIERKVLNSDAIRGSDVFRISDWMVTLIISERLRRAFERNGIRGLEYIPVT